MRSKRDKPHFIEVFAFSKRDIHSVCHAWKSGFRLVYTVVVTLGRRAKNTFDFPAEIYTERAASRERAATGPDRSRQGSVTGGDRPRGAGNFLPPEGVNNPHKCDKAGKAERF